MSGDSEVRTEALKRSVFTGYEAPCPTCLPKPKYETMYSKVYRTVTHTDAFLSSGRTITAGPAKFVLFTVGFADVYLTVKLDVNLGAFDPVDTHVNDCVIDPAGLLTGWPAPQRKGWLFSNPASGFLYHDGPWLLAQPFGTTSQLLQWRVLPQGQTNPYWTQPLLVIFRPQDIQAVTDDDHVAESRLSATLTGGIGGELGGSFGPFETTLSVDGALSVSLDQDHVIRDAVMAQSGFQTSLAPPRMRPITALSVRTRAQSSLDFDGLDGYLALPPEPSLPLR